LLLQPLDDGWCSVVLLVLGALPLFQFLKVAKKEREKENIQIWTEAQFLQTAANMTGTLRAELHVGQFF